MLILVKGSKVECSKPASKPHNTADSPLALCADELQGKEPVVCLGVQDNHHRFCRGRAHTQGVALEKSLKTRSCCDTPGLGEKGLQQFLAEISCTGIICYYSSLVPSSRGGEHPCSQRPLLFLSAQLSAPVQTHKAAGTAWLLI